MSLLQMQSALAMLIRLPNHHRNEGLDEFLKQYVLDPLEESQLRRLAVDPNVTKYGHSMEGVRMEAITPTLPISLKYMGMEVFELIHREHFARKAARLHFDQLAPEFLDFVLSDPATRMELKAAPPFIFDLVTFEREQLRFRRLIRIETSPASQGTLLVHSAFVCLNLNYDIPGFLLQLSGEKSEEAFKRGPEERRIIVLMLQNPENRGCRYFEIDESVESFLDSQRCHPPISGNLPESFEELVKIGLCKPLH